jgi:pSer/pThr/pTyr-binding forkhead associated (FHA) protein
MWIRCKFCFNIIYFRNKTLNLEISNNGSNKTLIFSKEKNKIIRIGRSKNLEIVLDNNWFSRIHTSFIFNKDDQEWYIQDGIDDIKSTNGTWYAICCDNIGYIWVSHGK